MNNIIAGSEQHKSIEYLDLKFSRKSMLHYSFPYGAFQNIFDLNHYRRF